MGRRLELKSDEKSKGIPNIVLATSRCETFAFLFTGTLYRRHHSAASRTAPNSLAISSGSYRCMGQCSVSLVIRDRGVCQHVLKGSSSTPSRFQQPPPSHRPTAAAAVVMRPSRLRVLKALHALPLQAVHLAYERSRSICDVCMTMYDVPARSLRLGQRSPVSSHEWCFHLCSRYDHHGHRR